MQAGILRSPRFRSLTPLNSRLFPCFGRCLGAPSAGLGLYMVADVRSFRPSTRRSSKILVRIIFSMLYFALGPRSFSAPFSRDITSTHALESFCRPATAAVNAADRCEHVCIPFLDSIARIYAKGNLTRFLAIPPSFHRSLLRSHRHSLHCRLIYLLNTSHGKRQ